MIKKNKSFSSTVHKLWEYLCKKENKMMGKIKAITLSVFVIYAVVAVIVYVTKSPENNVFREIYYAEMNAAEKYQNTPLSGTEYFEETKAEIVYRGFYTIYEIAKDDSPYVLSILFDKLKDDIGQDDTSKYVVFDITFSYKDLNLHGSYIYQFADKNVLEGVYVLVGSVEEKRNFTLKAFTEYFNYGIAEEEELKDKLKSELETFLNYWVDNYPKTKFKNDNFGSYEIFYE